MAHVERFSAGGDAAQSVEQIVRPTGLQDAALRTRLVRRLVESSLEVGGHQDGGGRDSPLTQITEQFRADRVGEPVVDEQELWPSPLDQVERPRGRGGCTRDRELRALQRKLD